jgi:rare lipoprotein A
MARQLRHLLLLSTVILLSGCVRSLPDFDIFDKPDAVPKNEPRSSRGNMPSYVINGKRYFTLPSANGYVERGIASWYGPNFHGKTTSNGETYDMHQMTAAHTQLPLPTFVKVTNLENGKTAVVRINDRGPFKKNRIIDLSFAAAKKLDIIKKGTGLVEVRAITADGKDLPPPSEPVKPAKHNIYIQVGAYGNPDNANRMKQQISSSLQRPVRIEQATHNGQSIYRVQVGPLDNVDLTDSVAARITEMGIATYIVID